MFEQDLDQSFDQMISTVYKQTSQHLLETLIGRYHFLDHLRVSIICEHLFISCYATLISLYYHYSKFNGAHWVNY